VTKGADKIEATPRRVRGLLGGMYVFDTIFAKFIWEHPFCASHGSLLGLPISVQSGQMFEN
jgi:hypothetical protein